MDRLKNYFQIDGVTLGPFTLLTWLDAALAGLMLSSRGESTQVRPMEEMQQKSGGEVWGSGEQERAPILFPFFPF